MFKVTQDMLDAVNEVWIDYISEDNDEYDDCELYLFVLTNGTWLIDHTQYFVGYVDTATMAPICFYSSKEELQEQLDLNMVEVS